jgi:hypothetical protein
VRGAAWVYYWVTVGISKYFHDVIFFNLRYKISEVHKTPLLFIYPGIIDHFPIASLAPTAAIEPARMAMILTAAIAPTGTSPPDKRAPATPATHAPAFIHDILPVSFNKSFFIDPPD